MLNKYLVGSQDNDIVITFPPQGRISKRDALELAAWLVAIATLDHKKEFTPLLDEVLNS